MRRAGEWSRAVLASLSLCSPCSVYFSRKQHVDHHIDVLHRYNEIKDVVQALMGKCAEIEGKTTKDMYEKFGLELQD